MGQPPQSTELSSEIPHLPPSSQNNLLKYLLEREGQVCTYKELYSEALGKEWPENVEEQKTLRRRLYIRARRLRTKADFLEKVIAGVTGLGYVLLPKEKVD